MSAAAIVSDLPTHPKAAQPIKGLQIKPLSDPRTIERLKVIDKYLFPVKYSDSHYATLAQTGFHHFNLMAYYHDALVGIVTARLEHTEEEGVLRLYVMTIGVLKAYRRLGIAAHLMQRIIDTLATKEAEHTVSHIALHVQVGSEAAYNFYKGFDFVDKGIVKDYYTDLEERDAHLLELVVPQKALAAKKAN